MSVLVSVVGGMNLDVTGVAAGALLPRDSNPGVIRFSPGGVGRNIAEQLACAGADTRLFTCLSDDLVGKMLEEDCARKKIDLSFARRTHARASCYMSVHDPDGDMALAVNDMALMDELTTDYLSRVLPEIARADVCVLDANLSPECLCFLAENLRIPLVADPVSVHKASRLLPILNRLAAIKPNRIEALSLADRVSRGANGNGLAEMRKGCASSVEHRSEISDVRADRASRAEDGSELAGVEGREVEAAAARLLAAGVRRCVLSLGARGAYYADRFQSGDLRPDRVFACQTTGAGDAMCAGIVLGVAMGLDARGCAELGMKRSECLLAGREAGEVNGG